MAYRIAKIQAKGEPTTLEELAARDEAQVVGENSAAMWRKAWDLHASMPLPVESVVLPYLSKEEAIPPGEEWPGIDEAERYLSSVSEVIALVHHASGAHARTQFSCDYRLGLTDVPGHVSKLFDLHQVMNLATLVALHKKESNTAADYISLNVSIALAFKSDQLVASTLAQSLLLSRLLQPIGWLCENSTTDDGRWIVIDARMLQFNALDMLRRSLITERAIVVSIDLSEMRDNWFLRFVSHVRFSSIYLDAMNEIIDFVSSPGQSWPSIIVRTNEWNQRYRESKLAFNPEKDFASLYLPDMKLLVTRIGKMEAAVRLARTAIAVRRYYDRHGGPPKSLDALTPGFLSEPLLDPFDNQPLTYVVSERRVLIYSKGTNGIDEKGSGEEEGVDDIAIEFTLPAHP